MCYFSGYLKNAYDWISAAKQGQVGSSSEYSNEISGYVFEKFLVIWREPLSSQEEFCSRKSVSQLNYCLSGFYNKIMRSLKEY
jgi:hypothetical protein